MVIQNRLAASDEGKSKAAEEDVHYRKKESALFVKMSSPPVLLNDVSDLVDGQDQIIDDEIAGATLPEPKRPRKM